MFKICIKASALTFQFHMIKYLLISFFDFPCRLVSIQEKFCTSKCKNQTVLSTEVACIYSSSAPKFRPFNGIHSIFNISPFSSNTNLRHFRGPRLIDQDWCSIFEFRLAKFSGIHFPWHQDHKMSTSACTLELSVTGATKYMLYSKR